MTEVLSAASSEVDWHRDPAASGWRSRAWLSDGWELLAYDDGRWEVRQGFAVAQGVEDDAEAAKLRAVRLYLALVERATSEEAKT